MRKDAKGDGGTFLTWDGLLFALSRIVWSICEDEQDTLPLENVESFAVLTSDVVEDLSGKYVMRAVPSEPDELWLSRTLFGVTGMLTSTSISGIAGAGVDCDFELFVLGTATFEKST